MGTLSNFPWFRLSRAASAVPAPITCRPAAQADLDPAVRLILAGQVGVEEGQVRDLARLAAAHAGEAGGLHVAEQSGGRLVSAVLPLVSPGRTMLLFIPTRHRAEAHAQATRRLVDGACARAAAEGVHLAQVLLDPDDTAGIALAGSCGFAPLAELLYLQATIPARYREPPTPAGLSWHTYAPELHERFARAIVASYADSLDCPGLNGLRSIDDVLAGHRATGEFDPDCWFLLARDAGPGRPPADEAVLLLSHVPRTDAVELVYLGVRPEARGRGLGDALMCRAAAVVASRGHGRLSLAVDADNTPALRLYWRHGMQAVGRKVALLRDLRGSAPARTASPSANEPGPSTDSSTSRPQVR